jgi:hypothetical protein
MGEVVPERRGTGHRALDLFRVQVEALRRLADQSVFDPLVPESFRDCLRDQLALTESPTEYGNDGHF